MVLGSCYYYETNNHKFLVDCGLFQGPKIEHMNFEPFPFDAKDLDFVLLTHTHIDHTGLLPKLSRLGFKGKLYCTTTSARLVELLLLDSAKIQESNLKKHLMQSNENITFDEIDREISTNPGAKDPDIAATSGFLYNTADAMQMLGNISSIEFGQTLEIADDLKVKFVDAGHILGAASLQITFIEDGKEKRILHGGDIGQTGQALISKFSPADGFKPDAIVMESTYGGKIHENRSDTVNKLLKLILETTQKGGNVIIPSFAAQRTQELLFEIKKAKMFGKLPINLEVFVDSPLATKITDVYQKSWKYLNAETRMFFENGDNAFNFPKLYFTRNSNDSRLLNKRRGIVMISGSGMCNGGRVLNHLQNNLESALNTVILVGYQAEDTLGRELAEGKQVVSVDGITRQVIAKIERLFGFSAHADQNGLMEFMKQYHYENTKKVILSHGEVDQATLLKAKISEFDPNMEVIIPTMKQIIEI